jgi:Sel1 repeat
MEYKKLFVYLSLFFLISCTEEIDPRVAFEKGDYASAFSIWKIRAEQNNLESQNYLGIHYLLGLGVRRDFTLAKKWYEKAAIGGYPDAQRNLGVMYESGHGLPRDFENAYIWLYAAYRQGHPMAGATLQSLVTKLSPNNKIALRKKAQKYIIEDVLEPDADDF